MLFRVIPSTVYRKITTLALFVFLIFPFSVGLCCRKICRPDTQEEGISPVLSFMYDLAAGQVICLILGLILTQNRVIALIDRTVGTNIDDIVDSIRNKLNALILSAYHVIEAHTMYMIDDFGPPPRMMFCEPLSQAELDAKLAVDQFERQFLFPATIFFLKAILMSILGGFITRSPVAASVGGPFQKLIEMVTYSPFLYVHASLIPLTP
jgi:hypothetical protein